MNYYKNNKRTLYLIAVTIVSFLVVFGYGLFKHIEVDRYYFDSLDYYYASKSFNSTGKFSFFNYSNTYRGYVFPLILYMYETIGSLFNIPDWIAILFGNSLVSTLLGVYLLPNIIFFRKKQTNIEILLRLIPVLAILFYWQDLIYYPLTDMYSYTLLLSSISILLYKDKINKPIFNIFLGVILGIVFYATYNVRPIYIFVIPVIIIINFYFCIKNNGIIIKKILLEVVTILFGASICAFPQLIVNQNQHQISSVAVITDDLNGGNIFTSQLYMGFMYDRFEGYVGSSDQYPTVQVNFIDSAGVQIIANEHIEGFNSIGEYLSIVFKYPIDYIGIMTRHLANVFYMPFNHVYIPNLNFHKSLFAVLNYTIIYLAFIGLIIKIKREKKFYFFTDCKLYLYATIIPCFAILPGAIEMRFFIPIYFPIYCFLTQKEIYLDRKWIKRNLINIILFYFISLFVFCGIWGGCMSSAQFLPQLLK